MKISAVILTKNEEKNIEECVKSLGFSDEILVVDDNSIDKTRDIAQKLGAKVFVRDMNKDYSAQSNFGMEKSQGDYVFFIDADERVTPGLASEILANLKEDEFDGYWFRRIDFMWGKWLRHGESGATRVLRLVKKGSGRWSRRVHPHFGIKGKTRLLTNPILHYPHPTLKDFVKSIDRWSSWHALANEDEGKKASLFNVIFWPCAHFVKNFFLRRGFLDGTEGFVYATIMSSHSFLAWSKLLLSKKRKVE